MGTLSPQLETIAHKGRKVGSNDEGPGGNQYVRRDTLIHQLDILIRFRRNP